ncbi:MAG: TRAP transporter large permease [Clostridium sp.]
MIYIGISLLLLLILGVPVSFSIGLISFFGVTFLTDIPSSEVFSYMILGLKNPLLLAVPLFILASNLMNAGQITDRLIDVCSSFLGHKKGGLAYVNILVSMIFAGITGSSQEDTLSVGGNLIPTMEKQGYDKETAVGVTAVSSTIGSVIPPSVTMVVYAVIAGIDAKELFINGIFPGLMMGSAMMLVVFLNRKKHFPKGEKVADDITKHRVMESLPALLTPIILIGGIISGWYTPTEAAVFACLYALIIGLFFYETIKIKDLPRIFINTMQISALPLFALATANSLRLLISYYSLDRIPIRLFTEMPGGTIWFLLSIEFIFLLIGMFIDAVPAIIIFVPLMLPTAAALGISPLLLGVITVMTLALGLVTPPYGPCLLIASRIAGIPMRQGFKGTLPYLISAIAILIILALCSGIPFFGGSCYN